MPSARLGFKNQGKLPTEMIFEVIQHSSVQDAKNLIRTGIKSEDVARQLGPKITDLLAMEKKLQATEIHIEREHENKEKWTK